LKNFTPHDLILIACLSAIGLAIKPIINPMIHIVTSAIRVPGGSLSGGFLMMWMVLARVLVNKPGSALLFGVAQGLTVMLLGFFGSHGVFSIVSYALPGLVLEAVALIIKGRSLFTLCAYCVMANITGTMLVAIFIMQLPQLLMVIAGFTAILSGMMGGWLTQMVLVKLEKVDIIPKDKRRIE